MLTPLPLVLIDAVADAKPVFTGITVDGTISLVWVFSVICAFVVTMAGFLFGLWLAQRDQKTEVLLLKETVSNQALNLVAENEKQRQENEKMRQGLELRIERETSQRMEDIRKIETKQAEAEKHINQKLQTIHESQLKSSACLESVVPAMVRIETTLHGLFEKYDLPLKK